MNDLRDTSIEIPERFPRRLKAISGHARKEAQANQPQAPLPVAADEAPLPTLRLSEEQLIALCREFQALKMRIEREAPQEVRLTALQHTEELEAVILYESVPGKTLYKLKAILVWFSEQLPAFAVTVSNLVIRPLAGRWGEAGTFARGAHNGQSPAG